MGEREIRNGLRAGNPNLLNHAGGRRKPARKWQDVTKRGNRFSPSFRFLSPI